MSVRFVSLASKDWQTTLEYNKGNLARARFHRPTDRPVPAAHSLRRAGRLAGHAVGARPAPRQRGPAPA